MLEWLEAHQLACLWKTFLGVECPGCGFQRAIVLLLKGDVPASCATWPALMPLLVFLILAGLNICGIRKVSSGMLKSVGFFCLIIILISYLLRLTKGNY